MNPEKEKEPSEPVRLEVEVLNDLIDDGEEGESPAEEPCRTEDLADADGRIAPSGRATLRPSPGSSEVPLRGRSARVQSVE